MIILLLGSLIAFGAPLGQTPGNRLRASTPSVRALIAEGLCRSQTIRDLVSELEASDLIVYVERGPHQRSHAASTTLVVAAGGSRFIRVTLNAGASTSDAVALLAHELQHVVEIARATDVRDSHSLRRLYERIGLDALTPDVFETAAAVRTQRRVKMEQHRSSGVDDCVSLEVAEPRRAGHGRLERSF